LFAEAADKPARRSRNSREISDRCARPAQQHPTRVALCSPHAELESIVETKRSNQALYRYAALRGSPS
jgi:hypothetical protein